MSKPGPVGQSLLNWIIAFTIICTVFLLLRLWAARMTKRRFFIDDAFVLVAFASTIACEGTIIWAICNGLGKPSSTVSPKELEVQAKVFAIPAAMTWLVATTCLKMSMLTLYLRIFTTAQYEKYIYIMVAAVSAYGLTFYVVFLTNCSPIYQLWHPVEGGWCRDATIEEFTSIAFNLFIDLAIVILPMPMVWKLQMPRHNKIFVTMMFSIGLITIAVMAWRVYITAKATQTTDFFLYLPEIGLVSQLELWLGLIAVCMPTLGPLIQTYLKPMLVSTKDAATRFYSPPTVTRKSNNMQTHRRQYRDIERGRERQYHSLEMPDRAAYTVTTCAHDASSRARDAQLKLGGPGGIYVRYDIDIV
ncbi:hypothetical protein HD806DRAFT_454516 [Xylariaceae sp. AK1471]|nr:hypothetical protein HD806DRAFT_454516 [Xylariaceae sp. AK1471]